MGVHVLKPMTQTSIFNKPINIQHSVTHLFHIIAAVCCAGEEVHFWRSVALLKYGESAKLTAGQNWSWHLIPGYSGFLLV